MCKGKAKVRERVLGSERQDMDFGGRKYEITKENKRIWE